MSIVTETNLHDIPLLRRGKVRDMYDLGDSVLMVATDRVSAFDVVMGRGIPDKGRLLTAISLFWFRETEHICKNHVITADVEKYPAVCAPYKEMLRGRSVLVKKCQTIPVECVVRGYLAGSGWKDYQATQTVCGLPLPAGLENASRLPEVIFTPATKAEEGHDENISFEEACDAVGKDVMTTLRDVSMQVYAYGEQLARSKGIILADTKFEFGHDADGNIILIDEVLTQDSSRYWLEKTWQPGQTPDNFDKQVLRDWLETTDWDKQAPAPEIPDHIVEKIQSKYVEALAMLSGMTLDTALKTLA